MKVKLLLVLKLHFELNQMLKDPYINNDILLFSIMYKYFSLITFEIQYYFYSLLIKPCIQSFFLIHYLISNFN